MAMRKKLLIVAICIIFLSGVLFILFRRTGKYLDLEHLDESCHIDQTCGDLVGVDCNSAADGPYYYVKKSTGKVVSFCGGYCDGRCTNCPPKQWTCPRTVGPKVYQYKVDLSVTSSLGRIHDGVYEFKGGMTVLSLLEEAAAAKNIILETYEQEPGRKNIRSINGEESRADKVWVYFVNGARGDLLPGEYRLKSDDKVAWEFLSAAK